MDAIQEKLEALNAVLGDALPFRLGLFDPNDLETLKQNARYMKNEMFAQLVANVKRDKALSSAPLVYAAPGSTDKPKVLSGNHRVLAARAAGLPRVLCLVVADPKSAEEQIAIQLSHNAIAGSDDLVELKRLYEEVRDIELKSYSGLDEDLIKQLSSIKFSPVSEPRLQFRSVSFLFLPAEIVEIRSLGAEVDKVLADAESYAFQKRDYAEFFDLLVSAKEKLNIKNSAVAILELMRAGSAKIAIDQAQKPAPDPPVDEKPKRVRKSKVAA